MSKVDFEAFEATINAKLQEVGASLESNEQRQSRPQTGEKEPPLPNPVQKASEFLLTLDALVLGTPFPMSA